VLEDGVPLVFRTFILGDAERSEEERVDQLSGDPDQRRGGLCSQCCLDKAWCGVDESETRVASRKFLRYQLVLKLYDVAGAGVPPS